MTKISKRKRTYLANKSAKVGELIKCPICGTEFKKKQYSQAFCCTHCKDTYWNAKGDRHSPGYYKEYDSKNPERMKRRILYGSSKVAIVGDHLTPADEAELGEKFSELLRRIDNSRIYSDDPLEVNECDFGQNEDFD